MTENPETQQKGVTTEPSWNIGLLKQKDFWIGFGGSIGGNILFIVMIYGLGSLNIPKLDLTEQTIPYVLMCLLPVINIAVLFLLMIFKRPRIVLGILASYAVTILVILCYSVIDK